MAVTPPVTVKFWTSCTLATAAGIAYAANAPSLMIGGLPVALVAQDVDALGATVAGSGDDTVTEVAGKIVAVLDANGTYDAVGTGNAAGVVTVKYTANADAANIAQVTAGGVTLSAVTETTKGSSLAAAGSLALTKMANNGTLELTAAGSGATVTMLDATSLTADSFNIVTKLSTADLSYGTVTVANVETIGITTTDTAPTVTTVGPTFGTASIQTASLTLAADKATTVSLAGNAALNLTLSGSTAVTLVDGSAHTGALILTANGAAAGTEVRGGAGDDVLTASGENDVLKGNAGKDTFNLTDLTKAYAGVDTVKDTFNFAINSNLTKVSTVYELGSGDVFNLKDVFNANAVVTKFYAAGAQYNPNTTTDVAGKVNAALVQTGAGEASWFNHGGNTYVVIDNAADGKAAGAVDAYLEGKDIVIEIVGTFNLGTGASFNATNGTLEII